MKKQLAAEAKRLRVGIGWDTDDNGGHDLDISAFLLNNQGKAQDDHDLIFYNNGFSANQALIYGGDNRTGAGDGMDESIYVDLEKIPALINSVVFCVTFNEEEGRHTFGEAHQLEFSVHIVNDRYDKTGECIYMVNLSAQHAASAGMAVFEISRGGSGWKYETICKSADSLEALCVRYGLDVE